MKRLSIRNSDWGVFAEVMEAGEAFQAAAVSGEPGGASGMGAGRLPVEYHAAVAEAEYTVFSYATPIAWRNRDGSWTCPDVTYSQTTSGHQSKIATAVDYLNR